MKTDFMEKHGIAKIYRAMILLVEWMCSDENVQVNGLKWFVDYTGVSMGFVSFIARPDDQKCLSKYLQVLHLDPYFPIILMNVLRLDRLGLFSSSFLKSILFFFFFFLSFNICTFEYNTTSDWLNHTV